MINLRKPWMRIVKRAGIEHVRLHDLRHSFASFAVSSGASLTLIGGQLGHRSIATTQRYAHLSRVASRVYEAMYFFPGCDYRVEISGYESARGDGCGRRGNQKVTF